VFPDDASGVVIDISQGWRQTRELASFVRILPLEDV